MKVERNGVTIEINENIPGKRAEISCIVDGVSFDMSLCTYEIDLLIRFLKGLKDE